MLTVNAIKSSSILQGYHLEQDGGYYIEDGKNSTLYQWHGRGAEKLGLVGDVNFKDYQSLFMGFLPNGVTIGKRMPDGTYKGRPGYDLTFSMNKDISLIICCSKDKALREYFLEAHHNAVKTVMSQVEKKAQARVTVGGVTDYITTGNLAVALCTHFSSREGDPQVHTHACVANATERGDGEWRALATDMKRVNGFYEMLRDNARSFGSIYQNEMAYAAKQKGFDLEKSGKYGLFQLQGMPPEVRDHFSKRRQAIKKIVTEVYGEEALKNKSLVGEVAKHSRASKKKAAPNDFMDKSKKDMAEVLTSLGKSDHFDGMLDEMRTIKPYQISKTAQEAIRDTIEYQSQFSVSLDASRIVNQAMTFDLGMSTHKDMLLAFEQEIKNGELIRTNAGRYTTTALIKQEKVLIDLVQTTTINNAVSQTKANNPKHFITQLNKNINQSRICVIDEPSSLNSKNTLLQLMISNLESQHKKVKVLAANKSMSNHYNEYARKHTTSIWQRLKQLGKPDLACGLGGFIYQYEKETDMPLNNFFSKKGKEVFIVDDAQRIGHETMKRLVDLTEKREAKLILLKHSEGRQNALAGNPIEIIQRAGVNSIDARQIQSSKKAVKQSCKKEVTASKIIITEAPCDSSKSSEKQAARHQLCAQNLEKHVRADHSGESLDKLLFVSSTQKGAEKLNTVLREQLKQLGKIDQSDHAYTISEPVHLSKPEQKHAKFYKKGMVLKTYLGRGQYRHEKVLNHDLTANKIYIQNEHGKCRVVSPNVLSKEIQANEIQLSIQKNCALSLGERCRLTHTNKQAKALSLKLDKTYVVVGINKKNIEVRPSGQSDSMTKSIKISNNELGALAIQYDYARPASAILMTQPKEHIFYESSARVNDNQVVSDLQRLSQSIEVITNVKYKTEKQLKTNGKLKSALDLKEEPQHDQSTPAEKALQYGLDVVGSKEAAFKSSTLFAKSLTIKQGEFNYDQLINCVSSFVEQKKIYKRENQVSGTTYTTSSSIKLETDIILQAERGKNALSSLLTMSEDNRSSTQHHNDNDKSHQLTRGQKQACRLISTTHDRFTMIQGYAGTGKSTMLQSLIKSLPDHTKVIAVAPTHRAVNELKGLGIEAQTLKSFLVDQQKPEETGAGDLKDALVILDESSMVSNSDFYELQTVIEKNNTRCAYLGDISQLTAVESGKPSEILYFSEKADMAVAVMDEHIRQKDPDLKEVAGLLMQGGEENVAIALERLDAMGCITECSPIAAMVNSFCEYTQEERAQLCVSVATNRDRNEFNELVRSQLISEGTISSDAMTAQKLVGSRRTEAELLYAQNYRDLESLDLGKKERESLVKYQDEYYQLASIDIKNNALNLKDSTSENYLVSLSHLPKHSCIELYFVEALAYARGDQVKFTKTDKSKGRLANTDLTIKSVNANNQSMVASDKAGNKHQLLLDEYANQHLDYNYCATVHGQQGRTEKGSLIALNTYNKKSNTMRLLYVGVTRATNFCQIYTDDKAKLKEQLLQNVGEKSSALEAMGLLKHKEQIQAEQTKDVINSSQKNQSKLPLSPALDHQHKSRLDAKLIESSLRDQVESVAKQLLGEPTQKHPNEWRYGSKGSLCIRHSGSKSGTFTDFEAGKSGGMVSLIMEQYDVPFLQALEIAERLLGGYGTYNAPVVIKTQKKNQHKLEQEAAKLAQKKHDYLVKLIEKSKPIEGTVAEKYLKNRGINDLKNTNLRYLHSVKTGHGNANIKPFSSALLAIARDKSGDPKAIQMTYLDQKTVNKVSGFQTPKRSIGRVRGHQVSLTPDIKHPNITFVSEGIETALSIRDATRGVSNAQVLVSLGKNNMKHLPLKSTADRIVLVLDNDLKTPLSDPEIQRTISSLEGHGKTVGFIYPEATNNQKTDYNDLAQRGQFDVIQRDIAKAIQSKSIEKPPQEPKNQLDKEVELEI